jgi:hypothetical protein
LLVFNFSQSPRVCDHRGRRPKWLTGLAHPTRMPGAGVRRGQESPLKRGIGIARYECGVEM